jgi:hypothetical protein
VSVDRESASSLNTLTDPPVGLQPPSNLLIAGYSLHLAIPALLLGDALIAWLLFTGPAASLVPARQALHVDPAGVLRLE